MARQQAGESKAPLVIALAFFVLTTLGLGVLAFTAYSDIEQANVTVAEAKKKEEAAVKLAETEKAKAQMYRTAVGTETEQDRTDLQNLRPDAETAVQAEFAAFQAALGQRVAGASQTVTKDQFVGQAGSFSDPKNVFIWRKSPEGKLAATPDKPILDQLVKFYADQQLAQIDAKGKQEKAVTAQAAAEQAMKDLQEIKAQYQAKLNDVPKTIADAIAGFQKMANDSKKEYVNAAKTFDEQVKANDKTKQDLNYDINQLKDQIGRLELLKTRLESMQAAQTDPFAYDRPQGKVLAKRGKTVDIDIGSADNVRPGLTFALHPSDTPEVGLSTRMQPDGRDGQVVVPKATIEVIEVLGPNLSRARVTEESNRIRDGVLTGDLLYNSVWRKGSADHIALFGIFDTNGDGNDDIARLAQEFERMGVIVDAYYDLGKKQWVGELSERTIYAIEGYVPFKTATVGASEAVLAAKSSVRDGISAALNEVSTRGIHTVKMRDFFPRIGYKVNLNVSEDRIDQAASRYLLDAGTKQPVNPDDKFNFDKN